MHKPLTETTPLVTVVTCVHNMERFLPDAIQSIKRQSYQRWEMILVNDASSDSTQGIIEKACASDVRIKCVLNVKQRGRAASRNLAIRCSTGEFIAILDADDIATPNRLEKQVSFMAGNPSYGIVAGLATEIDEYGANAGDVRGICGRNELLIWREMTALGASLIHSTVMYRRSLISCYEEVYDEAFELAHDKELWTRILLKTDTAILPDVLVKYRVHNGSASALRRDAQRAYALAATSRMIANVLPRAEQQDIEDLAIGVVSIRVLALKIELLREMEQRWMQRRRRWNMIRVNEVIRFLAAATNLNASLREKWTILVGLKGESSVWEIVSAAGRVGWRYIQRGRGIKHAS